MSDEKGSGGGDAPLPEWARPFVVVLLLVALMWIEEIVDIVPHTNFDAWGIRPRQLKGLIGIPLAPFLHAGFGHLIGNTIPFLILGGIIAASGVSRYLQVTVLIALVSGLGTWLIGTANTDHIGASGVVFGYFTYLIARGIFDRRLLYLVVGAVVLFVYGSIIWGVFPHQGISWEGHVFGAVGGVLAAKGFSTRKPGAGTAGTATDPKPEPLGFS